MQMDTTIVSSLSLNLMNILPKILAAIGIFILGIVVAKIARKMLQLMLAKTRIDLWGNKLSEVDIISKSGMQIVPSCVISTLVYYLLVIITLLIASDMLQLPTLSHLLQDILNYLPNLLVALTLLVIGTLLADFLRKAINTAGRSLGIPSIRMISSILFYFLFINILISALSQAGIDTEFLQSNLTMIIGGVVVAFGISYGLASKEILANFLAGYYHGSKLKVGDYIKVGEIDGKIVKIDKISIMLKKDDNIILIPLRRINEQTVIIYHK